MPAVSLSRLEPADATVVLGLLDAASLPTAGVQEDPTASSSLPQYRPRKKKGMSIRSVARRSRQQRSWLNVCQWFCD
jgi:hypothetical protein